VKVNITETTRQDVSLEVGKIQETVNLSKRRLADQSSSAQTGQAIDAQTPKHFAAGVTQFPVLLSLSSGVSGERPTCALRDAERRT